MDILIFVFTSYSLVYGLLQSKLGEPIRNKVKSLNNEWLSYLVECPFCSGFWGGIIIYTLMDISYNVILMALVSAVLSSIFYYIHMLLYESLLIRIIKRKDFESD